MSGPEFPIFVDAKNLKEALLEKYRASHLGAAVHNIVTANSMPALRLAIALHASLDVPDRYLVTPLMRGAGRGYTGMVAKLLDEGADVHGKDRYLVTAAMQAAGEGFTDTLKVLYRAGADLHAEDRFGGTALTRAEANNRTQTANFIRTAPVNTIAGHRNIQTFKQEIGHDPAPLVTNDLPQRVRVSSHDLRSVLGSHTERLLKADRIHGL